MLDLQEELDRKAAEHVREQQRIAELQRRR